MNDKLNDLFEYTHIKIINKNLPASIHWFNIYLNKHYNMCSIDLKGINVLLYFVKIKTHIFYYLS